MIDTAISAFLFGVSGVVLVKIVRLAELGNASSDKRLERLRNPFYYFSFFALPCVGGALSCIWFIEGVELTPLLAVNIGISAPALLRPFNDLDKF